MAASKFVAKDISGQTSGMLVAVRATGSKNGRRLWLCKCDCGGFITVDTNKFTKQHTKSCGCLPKSPNSTRGPAHVTRTYRIWQAMKKRCYYEKNDNFYKYGGRGITVCDRWRYSFQNFAADMGDPPTVKHTLDRIDGTKGYAKENCRWATPKEQAANSKKRGAG